MSLKDFRELVCWQLAHALKCEVLDFTASGPASRDFDFRDQIRAAAASGPANIAEAFGRVHPADAARILAIALGSLQETLNHVVDAHDRRYIDDRLYWRLMNLGRAAASATKHLMSAKRRQAVVDRHCR